MKKLILLLAIAFIGCAKDEIELRPFASYLLSFDMEVPGPTSKMPTCKSGNPNRIAYGIVNERQEEYVYFADLVQTNGRYITNSEISLPIGNYTLKSIDLLLNNEVLYSVPTTEDGTILHYADLILPYEFSLNRDINVSGKAFCYDQAAPPDLDRILEGGYEGNKLGSLFFYVQDNGCTHQVTVTINDYRIPEIFIWESGVYEVAIPQEYNSLLISSYDLNNNLLSYFRYTKDDPYTPDMLLIFNNSCE